MLLEEGALKNGAKLSISISNANNKDLYEPQNKILLFKIDGQHYITGSFCGFDYTNLANGIVLADKIICPTCASTYNIRNGFIEEGPTMRNISSYPTYVRKKKVYGLLPLDIAPF